MAEDSHPWVNAPSEPRNPSCTQSMSQHQSKPLRTAVLESASRAPVWDDRRARASRHWNNRFSSDYTSSLSRLVYDDSDSWSPWEQRYSSPHVGSRDTRQRRNDEVTPLPSAGWSLRPTDRGHLTDSPPRPQQGMSGVCESLLSDLPSTDCEDSLPSTYYEGSWTHMLTSPNFDMKDATTGQKRTHGESTIHAETPDAVSTASSTDGEAPTSVVQAPDKKRQRYLSDVDRYEIVRRMDKREAQSAIARDFGVSRTTVSHIKRIRDDVVARYEYLVSMIKSDPATNLAPKVQQVENATVKVLMTTLRDPLTRSRAFVVASKRLMSVLIEHVLTSLDVIPCKVRTHDGQLLDGVRANPNITVVSVGSKGEPLARVYCDMEPERRSGRIYFQPRGVGAKVVPPKVSRIELPQRLTPESNVVLMVSTSSSGDSICAALTALQEVHVAVDRVQVVSLAMTSTAVQHVCSSFRGGATSRGIRIITCAIEDSPPNVALPTSIARFSDLYKRHSDFCRGQLKSNSS